MNVTVPLWQPVAHRRWEPAPKSWAMWHISPDQGYLVNEAIDLLDTPLGRLEAPILLIGSQHHVDRAAGSA